MKKIQDYITELREEFTLKSTLGLVAMIIAIICLISYAFYAENENKKGIEIINSGSFVGEVIDKKFTEGSKSFTMLFYRADSYKMHITGEYLSTDNEVIVFNRNLTVDKDLFNRYEIGDSISN